MSETSPKSAWGRIANRGQLDMTVYTRNGATEAGIVLMPCAAFLAILCTDFETHVPVHYLDTAGLLGFVENMAPREVELYAGSDESVTDLATQIQKIINMQKGRAAEFAEATVARAARR